jgi:hypothetical protein
MCQSIGLLPISTIGLGKKSVSSLMRVPLPPHKITVFISQAPLILIQLKILRKFSFNIFL